MAKKILILNGPNLNLLGIREPAIYGTQTLKDIEGNCKTKAAELGFEIVFKQSNSEGALVDAIQEASADMAGIIINAGAYTHTSIAIHDALRSFKAPIIELHLSNIHGREDFRKKSYIALVATGIICGFGAKGYEYSIEAIADLVNK
jgi:3-dehydroquinate dehydratase-2